MAQKIDILVDGGKATAGPPLGPALGPTGINVMQVVKAINEKTAGFAGMKVPVTVILDPATKTFELTVGRPPTSALLLKELGAEKGSGQPKQNKVGDLGIPALVNVAKAKADDLQGRTLKDRVKEVMGTCVSMGITVDGKDPRDVQKAVDAGEYASELSD